MSSFARELFKKHKINTYYFLKKDRNLYENLSIFPDSGVGLRFIAKEWKNKNRNDDFYEITKVSLSEDLAHGKAWGKLYKNGRLYEDEHKIRKGLKLRWVLYEGFQPLLEEAKRKEEQNFLEANQDQD